jgi:hypothetical protein
MTSASRASFSQPDRSAAGNVDASIGAFYPTGTAPLSTSAGNVRLELEADPATGVWLIGVASLGSVTPPGTNGMDVLAQPGAEFEGRALNYSSFSNHYQVTCTSSLGNVEIGLGVTG